MRWRPPAFQDGTVTATIEWWQTQIRRTLLTAHLIPAILGLAAVLLLGRDGPIRTIDVVAWTAVVVWVTFLLAAGWRRAATLTNLGAWVLADAVVMAGLQFIGTSARNAVSVSSIDGALFATVFVSTRLGFLQIAVCYSGLAVAAIARGLGSDIPSPPIGWRTPLAMSVIAVFVFQFVRSSLDSLRDATEGHERLTKRSHEIASQAAAQEARLQGLTAIEEHVAPQVARLGELAQAYTREAQDEDTLGEARWIADSVQTIRTDLERLRDLTDDADRQPLEEALDTGILRATAAQILDTPIQRSVTNEVAEVEISAALGRAIVAVTREAVTNAATHGTPPITVDATINHDRTLEIRVTDRGPGYDPTNITEGQGLESLHRAAARVGGQIERHTTPDGHTVTFRVRVNA